MSQFLAILACFLAFSETSCIPTRFKRQYGWGGSPYYGNSQYYETQPQQWSSQYQNNQNYYSPYFYGYQHQQSWQSSNQNSYQSPYNRPSWISENHNAYATAAPDYNTGSYARPKYLATMQPKPTLSPVVLERSTVFVTQQPEIAKSTENGRHPTFLKRLGVSTLPVVPSMTSSEEEAIKSAEAALRRAEEETGTLKNGELLPGRASEERVGDDSSEDRVEEVLTTTSEAPTTEEEQPVVNSESSELEKDKIASSEFFSSSTETYETSEATNLPEFTEQPETTTTTTTEPTTPETTTTETSSSTDTTTIETTTTAEPITTTTIAPVKDVKPVTLLAFQEVTDGVTSSAINSTQPTVDQNTVGGRDLNETGDGSGSEPSTTEESRSTFSTGIVGLRSPPLPKTTDPEKVGLEVVEWTDSDNEVRKVLLTQ